MPPELIAFASYVGFFVGMSWLLTGALIWLRWGWVGVRTIWSIRKEADEAVAETLKGKIREVVEQKEKPFVVSG